MSWYVRSWIPGDVHRGVFDKGSVRAACGLEFLPLRVAGEARCCKLPEPGQVCSGCMAWADHQVVIPAICSRHPDEVISLVVRNLDHGLIRLESHTSGGCALTVPATLVFDALGGWLG